MLLQRCKQQQSKWCNRLYHVRWRSVYITCVRFSPFDIEIIVFACFEHSCMQYFFEKHTYETIKNSWSQITLLCILRQQGQRLVQLQNMKQQHSKCNA